MADLFAPAWAPGMYARHLQGLGVTLPLALCREHPGAVLDADGNEVFVVDVNRERTDEAAIALASLIANAANAAWKSL